MLSFAGALRLIALFFLVALGAFAYTDARSEDVAREIDKILAGEHRDPKNAARDRYRHPREVLTFFGARADMTVVEIWPTTGWWTEILGPLLKDSGRYYAAYYPSQAPNAPAYIKRVESAFDAKLAARPDLYGKVIKTTVLAPDYREAAPMGSADMVLTFRNVHNWAKGGFAPDMFKTFYDVLKPGGVLGVTDHRAKPGTPFQKQIESGYLTEDYVIGLAEGAGFKLAAKSEVSANARDTKDHPRGVWTLPPSLALGDQDRDKYLAIGESDRMTLKFVKP
jgi:predicted methyltransferase